MLHIGDARTWARTLPLRSIQAIVTSPPYFGLRSYLADDHPDKGREMGGEQTPEEFVAALVDVFAALRPALRDDGTLWLNLGDTYGGYHGNKRVGDGPAPSDKPGYRENMRLSTAGRGGIKPKDLLGIPWRVAFALQADGWTLRSDIIWHKPNPTPESVTDRPTKSHEYLFLLTKQPRYFYDASAVAEAATTQSRVTIVGRTGEERIPGRHGQGHPRRGHLGAGATRNRRTVWTIPTRPYPEAHYATFPPDLIRPCILAGSRLGDTVADPFAGSGTTWQVAVEEGRLFVGCDIDERSAALAAKRLARVQTRSDDHSRAAD